MESKNIIAGEGIQAFQEKAENEFGEFRIAALSKIMDAIIDQALIYATANISYGPKPEEGEASDPKNPTSSAAK